MKKILIMGIVILITVLFAAGFFYIKYVNSKEVSLKSDYSVKSSEGNYEKVAVTKENLPDFLRVQGFVQDLPDDGVILVRLYSFNSDERVWEESYVITKGDVKSGSVDKADVTIILSSKYVPELGDFCSAVQKAKKNGDIGFESSLSKTALAWKYKSMAKYRSCFGI